MPGIIAEGSISGIIGMRGVGVGHRLVPVARASGS